MSASTASERVTSKVLLLRATALMAASRLVGTPVSLLIAALLTHNLARSDYAFYGALNSFSLLFVVVAQFCYQTGIVRIIGEHQRAPRTGAAAGEFTGALLVTGVVGMALAGGFLLVGRGWLPRSGIYPISLYFLAAGVLLFKAINTVSAEALRGLGCVGFASIFNGQGTEGGLVRAVISLALLATVFAAEGLNLKAAVGIAGLSSLLCALMASVLVYRLLGGFASLRDVAARAAVRVPRNFDFLLAQLLQIACSGAVANIIGANVLEAASLAGFIAAIQVLNLLNAPLTLLNGAAPSLLIKFNNEGKKEELEELLRLGASFAFLIACCACSVLLAIGPAGFQFVFGSNYADSYFHFACLVPALLVTVFTGMSGRAILLIGRVQTHRNIMFVASAISVPLYYVAATTWGVYGLTAALSFSLIFQNAMLAVAARRQLGVSTLASINPGFYLSNLRKITRKAKGKFS